MSTRAARALLLGVVAAASFSSPHGSVGAQTPDLPPDDGAPPEEYAPNPDAPDGGGILDQLTAGEPEAPPVDNAFPIAGRLRSACTDSFGDPRGGGRTHMGVDCFAPMGTPLVAVEDGWIRYAQALSEPYNCSTGGGDLSGNRVSVRGRSGYVYYYGHLDSILVATDQPIAKGEVIGTVGRTGNASCTAPHLHIEVKCGDNGEPFDPYPAMGTWGRVALPNPRWLGTDLLGGTIAFSGDDREDVFALRCGQQLQQRSWRAAGGLTGWAAVDGVATSDPDAASPGAGWTAQAFERGGDNAVWHLYQSGSTWTVASLGGICTSGPTAAFADPDHLDVFCRGGDHALWRRSWVRASGWSGWERVGGVSTSDPDAASPGPGYPAQVFTRGTDDGVWHIYWNGSTWAVESLGGTCSSGPAAAFSGPSRLDVFCRGADYAIWHRYWTGASGWASWERVGGIVISDPDAASPGPGFSANVVARGLDRQLYEFSWDGQRWISELWGVT